MNTSGFFAGRRDGERFMGRRLLLRVTAVVRERPGERLRLELLIL